MNARAPRLLVAGAFAWPVPQGSQVFAGEQARALVEAGADVTVLCYGRGRGEAAQHDPAFAVERIPAWTSPRSSAAGPRPRKPLADAALGARLVALCRRHPFDAVLAHNAEAACVALAARPWTGVPVVYVAHTLLAAELPAYARPIGRGAARRLGRRIDRGLAARADAVQALTRAAASALAPARGELAVIPPGLTPRQPPDPEAVAAACRARGLEPGRFALYAGNLDAYQDPAVLAVAAAALPDVPVVAATHGPPRPLGAVRVLRVEGEAELRALTAGAGATLLPRRTPGGFPVKLLNYMEAARPVVAREGLVDGLVHDRNAWLVPWNAGGEAFAEAVFALLAHPPHAAALGAAARATLEAEHAWPALARRTLDLVGRVIEAAAPAGR